MITIRHHHRIAGLGCLLAIMLMGLIPLVSAQVTVELVNDSGNPDANVYVKVPGRLLTGVNYPPITPTNLFVDIAAASPPNPSSVSLSTLTANSQMVSPVSGNTNKVYQFTADFLNSGSIYFTYNQPFNFANGVQPSPSPGSAGSAFRYDYAELSIDDSNAPFNAVDVTYVDKFGIPLQMEWFKGTNLVAGSYVYASTKTLAGLFASAGLGQAVFGLNAANLTPGWQYTNSHSYTNFARILAPQKVSGGGTSVSPYPGVTNLLNSLTGKSNAFWLNGASPQGGYYYVGYQASISTNASGWVITLANAPNPPAFNPTLILGTQYTNTITFPITYAQASQYVYGAPVGPNYYSVNGTPVTSAAGPTYAVETWMIGDVLSALNFGFWGGRYGTNSVNWFSEVEWTAFPFSSARTATDGYYNPYAALIYNIADPYSFAFSERITPDVLMSPGNGDRLRITLLPDDRLDSPVVLPPATNMISSNSITLNWTQVAGATGYRVNVLRPATIAAVNLPSTAASYTLTNLQPGTPYVMSVQATGTNAGNPVITPARPVSATTTGTLVPVSGNLTRIQVTFNAADPYYQLGSVYINGTKLVSSGGQWLAAGVPARWNAAAGTNRVVVTVVGTNNQVLFNDWLTFQLAPPFAVTNGTTVTTNSAISNVFLYGQKLSQPAPGVSGFLSGTATNFPVSIQNISLSIGLTYVPAESRKYAAIQTPGPGSLILTNAAMLSSGAFQFKCTNSGTQGCSVYVSTNLSGWTAVGAATLVSPGLYQFTDPGATNYPRRFYRVSSP